MEREQGERVVWKGAEQEGVGPAELSSAVLQLADHKQPNPIQMLHWCSGWCASLKCRKHVVSTFVVHWEYENKEC